MTSETKHVFTTIIRCLLILLFCYTAVNKWLFYNDFLYQLKQSPFIPAGYGFLSVFLPLSEVALSILLVVNATAKGALAASAILLLVFTLYITAMLLFAPHIPCSCGGFISSFSWPQHIALNSTLTGLAFISYKFQKGKQLTIHQIIIAIIRGFRKPVTE